MLLLLSCNLDIIIHRKKRVSIDLFTSMTWEMHKIIIMKRNNGLSLMM